MGLERQLGNHDRRRRPASSNSFAVEAAAMAAILIHRLVAERGGARGSASESTLVRRHCQHRGPRRAALQITADRATYAPFRTNPKWGRRCCALGRSGDKGAHGVRERPDWMRDVSHVMAYRVTVSAGRPTGQRMRRLVPASRRVTDPRSPALHRPHPQLGYLLCFGVHSCDSSFGLTSQVWDAFGESVALVACQMLARSLEYPCVRHSTAATSNLAKGTRAERASRFESRWPRGRWQVANDHHRGGTFHGQNQSLFHHESRDVLSEVIIGLPE